MKSKLETTTDNDSPLLKSMLQSTKTEIPNSPKGGAKRKNPALNPRRPIESDFINGPRETGLGEKKPPSWLLPNPSSQNQSNLDPNGNPINTTIQMTNQSQGGTTTTNTRTSSSSS